MADTRTGCTGANRPMGDDLAISKLHDRAGPQKRLTSEARRDQILDAAARLVVEQGMLPVPLERLARGADVSKALIYTYFPTQYDLFNALLARELTALADAGLDSVVRGTSLEDVVRDATMLYFEHVVRWGPLLQILLSDLYMAGRHERETLRLRNAMVLKVARLARREIPLSAKEIVASINMTLAIPEEAGTLAFNREVDFKLARDMCRTLSQSALKGLRSCVPKPTPEWGF